METLWEGEDDVISKILNGRHDVGCLEDHQAKSLHQEFMEIGEKYELPIIKKRYSLENMLNEFQQLNNVAEEKLKDVLMEETASKLADNKTKPKQKVLKSPPGFLPKFKSLVVKPPPGFPSINNYTVVEPPPGFTPKNMESEIRPPPGFPAKSDAKRSDKVKLQVVKKAPFDFHQKKDLKVMMEDFQSLSHIMDQELSSYENNMLKAREDTSSNIESIKEQGKVEMMKTLFYEQQDRMKSSEKKYEDDCIQRDAKYKNKLKEMNKQYEAQLNTMATRMKQQQQPDKKLQEEFNRALNRRDAEIENLNAMVSDLQCELEAQANSPNQKLQFEFNRVLNEREEEIDCLNGQLHDMQCQLDRYEGGADDIAMEVCIDFEWLIEIYHILVRSLDKISGFLFRNRKPMI